MATSETKPWSSLPRWVAVAVVVGVAIVASRLLWQAPEPVSVVVVRAPEAVSPAVVPAPGLTVVPDAVPAPAVAAPAVAPKTAEPAVEPARVGAPSFDIVRVGPEGRAVIAGRASPGADVIVRDGAAEVGRGRADRQGSFVVLPAAPLAPGGRELSLSARTAGGAEVSADAWVVLNVPPVATPAPVEALLVPSAGVPRVLQEKVAPPVGVSVTLDTVDYDDAGAIRFTGGAGPGGVLRLYIDNALAGEARASAAGRWTVTPAGAVAAGVHTVRVDHVGADGQVLARVELPFQRAAVAAAEVAGGRVVVQPGQSLWRLARLAYGRGVQYRVIYLANREQIRDPRLIYPGQTFAVPTP